MTYRLKTFYHNSLRGLGLGNKKAALLAAIFFHGPVLFFQAVMRGFVLVFIGIVRIFHFFYPAPRFD
jgi:hypothetical protein